MHNLRTAVTANLLILFSLLLLSCQPYSAPQPEVNEEEQEAYFLGLAKEEYKKMLGGGVV